jgi:Cu/Ag efflux pump CusA
MNALVAFALRKPLLVFLLLCVTGVGAYPLYLGSFPDGAPLSILPASATGDIYRYRVVGRSGYSATDLQTIQDWILKRRFRAVPDVIDVTSSDGKTTVDADWSNDGIVQGIVRVNGGERSIERVDAEVATINSSGILPPGIHIEQIRDQAELVNITTYAVLHGIVIGLILILFVQGQSRGKLRDVVITSTSIPLALILSTIITSL